MDDDGQNSWRLGRGVWGGVFMKVPHSVSPRFSLVGGGAPGVSSVDVS